MLNKQTKFFLAMVLQTAVIFVIIIFKLSILTGGTEIMLRIAPVDPRDLLRGDYVTFRYDISSIGSHYAKRQEIKNGDVVYIVLGKSGKYWGLQRVEKDKPTGNDLFIKGIVRQSTSLQFNVVYGIEEYFIPEGKGQNFRFQNKEAAARVFVDENGNSLIKQIFIDDKPWP